MIKNIITKLHHSLFPLALASIFTLLFTQCNADRPNLPKEYNILRFKVDGEQLENPTECGEWLSGCDPIVLDHGISQSTTEFEGGGIDADGNGHSIYIYIYKKFILDTPIILDSNDDLIYYKGTSLPITEYTNLVNYNFMFTDRNSEEGWIEGEFDFTAANNEGDTVEITDGYFKLTIDVY
jgi:hypothetical protein